VEKSVKQALKMGANAFNWLWEGLPPAERVVVSAMAEVDEEIITQDKLIEKLNQSGVRLIARELEIAPETLIDWELLYRVNEDYRFSVPLLQYWVKANRPLRRVKDELDRLNPLADTLFQAGQGYYNSNSLSDAEAVLRQALNINPNHLKARLLLGRVYLDQNKIAESVEVLDGAYQFDERAARADLLKSLLALVEQPGQDEAKQMELCERILRIQTDQPVAKEKKNTIWIQRGDAAFEKGDFDSARKSYESVGYQAGVSKAAAAMRDSLLKNISSYLEEEKWDKVVEICEPLSVEFPDDELIITYLRDARKQLGVARKYHEALGALENGKQEQSRILLTEILSGDPSYGRAASKLVEAIYGKVRISLPVHPVVTLLMFITSSLWTVTFIIYIQNWIYKFFLAKLETTPDLDYIYIENFFVVGLIFIPLIGGAINYYSNSVVDMAYQVERKNYSFGKALWTHFAFGLGMFYLARETRRKWVYTILAALLPALILANTVYQYFDNNKSFPAVSFPVYKNGPEIMEQWLLLLSLALLGYGLSFVDIVLTCYNKRNKSKIKPATPYQTSGWSNALVLLWPVLFAILALWIIYFLNDQILSYIIPIVSLVVGGIAYIAIARGNPQKFSLWKLAFVVSPLSLWAAYICYFSLLAFNDRTISAFATFWLYAFAIVLSLGTYISFILSSKKYGAQSFQTWLMLNLGISSLAGTITALVVMIDSGFDLPYSGFDAGFWGVPLPPILILTYFALTDFKTLPYALRIGLNSFTTLGFLLISTIIFLDYGSVFSLNFRYIVLPLLAMMIVSLAYKFSASLTTKLSQGRS
jgi:tetratricopeptide (TPR) repeat protein